MNDWTEVAANRYEVILGGLLLKVINSIDPKKGWCWSIYGYGGQLIEKGEFAGKDAEEAKEVAVFMAKEHFSRIANGLG